MPKRTTPSGTPIYRNTYGDINWNKTIAGAKLAMKTIGSISAMRQDREHIYVPYRFTQTITNQYDLYLYNVQSDMGSNILPTGSKFVDEDHRFDVLNAMLNIYFSATKMCSLWVLLVARESSASVIGNTNRAYSATQTLEENIAGAIVSGEYDYEVVSPMIVPRLAAHDGTNYLYEINTSVDLTSVFQKINQNFWSTEETVARKYDLHLIILTEEASCAVACTTPLIMEGIMKLARNRML